MNWIRENPALVTSFVTSAIILAIAFGAPINDSQRDAILGIVSAALMLVGGVVTRSQVVPVGRAQRLVREAYNMTQGDKMKLGAAPPKV